MPKEICGKIPGGWYGNDPGQIPGHEKRGNVVVDPNKVAGAILWLHRRAMILQTRVETHVGNPGVFIDYELR